MTVVEVQQARADDVPALVDVFMDAFVVDDTDMSRFFPPGAGGVGEAYLRAAWAHFVGLQRRPGKGSGGGARVDGDAARESEVLVVRDADGVVRSAVLTWPLLKRCSPLYAHWPPFLPGMAGDEFRALLKALEKQHQAAMRRVPHLSSHVPVRGPDASADVEIVMTHSSARGRGYASALLCQVCARADDASLALYLDSMPLAMPLYARHGFKTQPDSPVAGPEYKPMVRPAKTDGKSV